jgi:hypothetical protein
MIGAMTPSKTTLQTRQSSALYAAAVTAMHAFGFHTLCASAPLSPYIGRRWPIQRMGPMVDDTKPVCPVAQAVSGGRVATATMGRPSWTIKV